MRVTLYWPGVAALCAAFTLGCGGVPDAGAERPAQGPPPGGPPPSASAVVQLRKTGVGWELTRNGSPYFVRGAGGEGSKELLARLGGNSTRTWGADDLLRKLDDAARNNV